MSLIYKFTELILSDLYIAQYFDLKKHYYINLHVDELTF